MRICRTSHRISIHRILCATSMCAHQISSSSSSAVFITKWWASPAGMHALKYTSFRSFLHFFVSRHFPQSIHANISLLFLFSLWNKCEKHKSKCFERSIYYLRSFKINSQVGTMESSVWCGSVRANGWANEDGDGDGERMTARNSKWKEWKERRRKENKNHCKKRQPMETEVNWIHFKPSSVMCTS